MKKYKMSHLLICLLVIVLATACSTVDNPTTPASNIEAMTTDKITYTVKVVDLDTKEPIEKSYVSILEATKKYQITSTSNKIVLPAIENKDMSKYPYGYSLLTTAEGYLPRIDHSIMAATGEVTIELKRLPTEPSNEAYNEYFHGAAMNEAAGIFGYYENLPAENE